MQVENRTAPESRWCLAATRDSSFRLATMSPMRWPSREPRAVRNSTRSAKGRVAKEVETPAKDADLLVALRNGDDQAFAKLVEQYHGYLIRAATKYVRDPATAADVAQETWIGFLDSLDRFQGRCSIKTWLFRILFNKAQAHAKRDRRLVPFSTLVSDETSSSWNSVDPGCFKDADDPVEPGHWVSQPPSWKTDPERIVERAETLEAVRSAIDELPAAQGTVMLLRDLTGLSSKEVCDTLDITPNNQRVLLHRARAKVRRALAERYGVGI